VFAFANAGISLTNISLETLTHGVPVGIAMGLFIGKQIGVFGLCWLAIKLGMTQLPKGMNWLSLYGISALCGIGFTMSIFIGSLAFEGSGAAITFDERLGITIGSLLSGILGYFVLRKSFTKDSS
jgi:NhaA family Na+:H+ antiporter